MAPYILLLLFVLILSFTIDKLNNHNNKKLQFFFKLVLITSLALFSGLRSNTVGTDTNGYLNSFINYNNGSLLDFSNYESNTEIGFKVLETLIRSFSSDPKLYLFLVSLFILFFQLRIIYKISVIPYVSVIILITWGIYLFSFNGLRQAIAASIFLMAIPSLMQGKFKKYCLIVLFGFLFHKTIIITLPLYFLFRMKYSYKFFALLLLSSFVIFYYSKFITFSGELISDKYSIYSKINATGGYQLTILYILLTGFFIFCRRLILLKFLKVYDIFLKMFIIGTIVFTLVTLTSSYVEITRIAFYFTCSILFIWPILIKSVNVKLKPMFSILFVFINLVYFITFINKIGNLLPYTFSK